MKISFSIFQSVGALYHEGVIVFPAIFRFLDTYGVGYKLPGLLSFDLGDIEPGALIHRDILPLGPHNIIFPFIRDHCHIQRNNLSSLCQAGTVLFEHRTGLRPILFAHGVPALFEFSHRETCQ